MDIGTSMPCSKVGFSYAKLIRFNSRFVQRFFYFWGDGDTLLGGPKRASDCVPPTPICLFQVIKYRFLLFWPWQHTYSLI